MSGPAAKNVADRLSPPPQRLIHIFAYGWMKRIEHRVQVAIEGVHAGISHRRRQIENANLFLIVMKFVILWVTAYPPDDPLERQRSLIERIHGQGMADMRLRLQRLALAQKSYRGTGG